MLILQTPRLSLRHLERSDAAFVMELFNDPDCLRFIGDRGCGDIDGALRYLENGPLASYDRHGFGMYLVEPRDGGEPAGVCGLLKRDTLEDVDIGFAFLPRVRRRGYAYEAAAALLGHARRSLGLGRILAITSPDNEASIALLGRLGFNFAGMRRLAGDPEEVRIFASEPVTSG